MNKLSSIIRLCCMSLLLCPLVLSACGADASSTIDRGGDSTGPSGNGANADGTEPPDDGAGNQGATANDSASEELPSPDASEEAENTPSGMGPEDEKFGIELRRQDPSIPPMYHRSYRISFSRRRVVTEVDVYGDIIAKDERAFTWEEWSELRALTETTVEKAASLEDSLSGPPGEKGYELTSRTPAGVGTLSWRSRHPRNDPTERTQLLASYVAAVESFAPNLQLLLATEYSQ